MAKINNLLLLFIFLLCTGLTMNVSAGLVCPDGVICDGDPTCDEECDDGDLNADAPNACRTDCTLPACGDGITDDAAPYNEECDDMNVTNLDGCDSLCQLEDPCIDFTSEPTSCGVGVCAAAGVTTCDSATGELGDTCVEGSPSAEICDGLDNDCDGGTDEDIASTPTACGVGACAAEGTTTCEGGVVGDSCIAGTPTDEVCGDGIDNDCNGQVDELPSCSDQCIDFTSEPTSCGVGVCAAAGVTTCDSATGELGDTCVEGSPTAEICDGLDNDCDGGTDEEIASTPTACGVGACAAEGTTTCEGGVVGDSCLAGTPTEEVCDDGIDNDCNGQVDELPSCSDQCIDFTSEPTSCGVGICAAAGVTTCDSATGELGDTCVEGSPETEVCDGLDNDCNGQVDELPSCSDQCIDFTSEPTSCGVGECAAAGVTTCDSATGDIGDTCEAGTPVDEICDGLDNNCDGSVDDGIAPVPTSCGVGECAATGEASCVDGQTIDACTPGDPVAEVCDSLDNDCDGLVDEDASCNGATVIIDGCDSGVTDTGAITDGILACAVGARNHGQFVRCSARFLNGLGLTFEEKEAIQACVGSSDLGKKEKTNGE